MKILLISESPIIKKNNTYYSKDSWINFPLYISNQVEKFSILCTTKNISNYNSSEYFELLPHKANIYFHSDYSTFVEYYKKYIFEVKKWSKIIEKLINEHDIIWVRMPSPIFHLIFKYNIKAKKKIVIFAAGDIEKQSDTFITSKGIKKFLIKRFISRYINREVKLYNKANLIYCYSSELIQRYQKVNCKKKLFRTPLVKKNEIVYRYNACENKQIILLRVCWLLPSKGIENLLKSLKILITMKYNIILNIIGDSRNPDYKVKLNNYIKKLKLQDSVKIMGWKTKSELIDFYKTSDIHVISSLSEGTPRVIMEGMAKGVPLITTNVGGISDFFTNKNQCLIVNPTDIDEMVKSIELMVNNRKLRSRIIENGYKDVNNWCVENKSLDVIEDMKLIL